MEKFFYETIATSSISDQFPYACRYGLEDLALKESVSRHGVLFPLVGLGDPFCLVAGHRRYRAAVAARVRELPVLKIRNPITPRELFLLSVLSNWNTPPREWDKVFAYQKAVGFGFTEEELLQEILPAMGLPGRRHALDELRTYAHLETALQNAVAAGKIPFQGAKHLAVLTAVHQAEFARLVGEQMLLNSNQLSKVAEWLADLLPEHSGSLESFFRDRGLWPILEHPGWDPRCRADRFFEAMAGVRFPRVKAYREKWTHYLRRGKIDGKIVRLEPLTNFEEAGLVLGSTVRDPEDYDRLIKILKEKRDVVHALFEVVL